MLCHLCPMAVDMECGNLTNKEMVSFLLQCTPACCTVRCTVHCTGHCKKCNYMPLQYAYYGITHNSCTCSLSQNWGISSPLFCMFVFQSVSAKPSTETIRDCKSQHFSAHIILCLILYLDVRNVLHRAHCSIEAAVLKEDKTWLSFILYLEMYTLEVVKYAYTSFQVWMWC